MANVQFGGLITGLDTNALIAGLVKVEHRSVDVLQAQKVRYQAQDGVFTALISALGNLKSSAQGLSLANDFNKRSASSNDSTVVTAAADSTASVGSYSIVVDRLAAAKTIRSTSFASTTAAIGTGTLTLTVGSTNTSVTVDGTNNTLTGLKDAINGSGAAVTASIVNVGTSATPDYRLVVQSKETGTENAVTISGTLAGGADPFSGGGEVVQGAADALFSINGLTVTRAGNTVSDVVKHRFRRRDGRYLYDAQSGRRRRRCRDHGRFGQSDGGGRQRRAQELRQEVRGRLQRRQQDHQRSVQAKSGHP
ncbi:MAG: hypothetical protein HYY82_18255 [Deltaproteobacteria bacterium]|nr:hypothetical protein [Deltaproteobacteria bacterium]